MWVDGEPVFGHPILSERFWEKVRPNETGCWLWIGASAGQGYGRYTIGRGVEDYSHRVAYEAFKESIPASYEIDHLCKNRTCCNPSHLEAVTHLENVRRSPDTEATRTAKGARNRTKTHCPQGHPYDEKNTYINTQGHRACRACRAQTERERKRRLKGQP